MPKLPANYVKGPSFDNPLRSTGAGANDAASPERRLMLSLDEAAWEALKKASERDGVSPEALVRRALERFLAEPARVESAAALPSRRAQLIDRLLVQFALRNWAECLATLREIVREGRGGFSRAARAL